MKDKGAGPLAAGLEGRIGYVFSDPALLREALTHKSHYIENPRAGRGFNERLEFLGDSVLGLSVVDALFRHEGGLDESVMSKVKAYAVKARVLHDAAMEIGLGEHLLLGRGEEETGGRRKVSVLADAFEALVGAVYLDGGYESARRMVLMFLGPRISEALASGEFHDYKTELQELCQMRFGELPEYRLLQERGLDHEKTFLCAVFVRGEEWGRGEGGSKKAAETAAAKEALGKLSA